MITAVATSAAGSGMPETGHAAVKTAASASVAARRAGHGQIGVARVAA